MTARATFDRASLLQAAARARQTVNLKNVSRALSMAKLEAQRSGEHVVEVHATDLVVATKDEVAVTLEGDAFSLLVPADKLLSVLKSFSADKVVLDVVDDGARVRLSCGRSKVHLAALPGDDYPDERSSLDESYAPAVVSVPRNVLETALRHGALCMCEDESRPHMNGAMLEVFGKTLRVVSTDGHRLAVCDVECENVRGDVVAPVLALKRCVDELHRFAAHARADDVRLLVGKRLVEAEYDDDVGMRHSLVAQLAREDVRFPPWEKVVQLGKVQIVVRVDEFLSALDVAGTAAGRDRVKPVTLQLVDEPQGEKHATVLRVIATSADGDADSTTDVAVTETTAEMEYKAGFNAAYLDDALRSLADLDVDYASPHVSDSMVDAVIFKKQVVAQKLSASVTVTHVVMPMRM